jgi:hypothetical protein
LFASQPSQHGDVTVLVAVAQVLSRTPALAGSISLRDIVSQQHSLAAAAGGEEITESRWMSESRVAGIAPVVAVTTERLNNAVNHVFTRVVSQRLRFTSLSPRCAHVRLLSSRWATACEQGSSTNVDALNPDRQVGVAPYYRYDSLVNPLPMELKLALQASSEPADSGAAPSAAATCADSELRAVEELTWASLEQRLREEPRDLLAASCRYNAKVP